MTAVVFTPAAGYWPPPGATLASKFYLLGVRREEHFAFAEFFWDDFDAALEEAFARRDLALVVLVTLAKERRVSDVARVLASIAAHAIAHAPIAPGPDELRLLTAALGIASAKRPDRGVAMELSIELIAFRGPRAYAATTAAGHLAALAAQHTHVGAGARAWVVCELLAGAVTQALGELGARPVLDELVDIARRAFTAPENVEAEGPASPSAS